MKKITLICSKCKTEYSDKQPVWQCKCGGLLDLKFEPSFPLDKIKNRPQTMWRYREAIPIHEDKKIISFNEGFTPLVNIDFDEGSVMVKQDQLFPTGSFKDRGTTVLMSKINELGIKKVIEDSSGNAGSSVAAYSARGNIMSTIYVPEQTLPGKLVQMEAYGSKIKRIQGSREDTTKAVLEAAKNTYYASHSWNPYFQQGTKTFGFEICEQLNWQVPDTVILTVGGGSLFIGANMGFKELKDAGIIEKIPKMIAVQAKNCAPIYEAYNNNKELKEIEVKETIADGLARTNPIRGNQVLDIVKETNGAVIIASEDEIKEELSIIIKKGFYIEPTSATVVVGIKKYLKSINKKEVIVSAFTGHGLKATDKIRELCEKYKT